MPGFWCGTEGVEQSNAARPEGCGLMLKVDGRNDVLNFGRAS